MEPPDPPKPSDAQTFALMGAAMEVHRRLGPGFLESVYHAALAMELRSRGVPFLQETEIPVYYRNTRLGVRFRADFVAFGEILVELKAVKQLTSIEHAQVINYLLATRLQRGILLNFGASSLQFRRFVGPRMVGGDATGSSVQSVVSSPTSS